MTALVTRFALIGRSFPRETYEGLHEASVAARTARRGSRPERTTRAWRGLGDAIIVPERLYA